MTQPMTERGQLKGKIQTVLGPIDPASLGRTLMHEHVLCDIRPPGTRSDNDLGPEITLENVWQMNYGRGLKRAGRKYMLDLEDIATREVAMMKHQGGDAIVQIRATGGSSPALLGLHTGDSSQASATYENARITLVELQPYPFSSRTIAPEEYRATLTVTQ